MGMFYNPVKVEFGWGMADRIPSLLPRGKALVVTGKSSTKAVFKRISAGLASAYPVLFDCVEANPSVETTEHAIRLFEKERCDFVIGLGGGSPLDCAKAVALLAGKKMAVLDVLHQRVAVEGRGVPFYAIPTTAGTGSEVTPFSIITDTTQKKKISIATPLSFPEAAWVDPEFTVSMPPDVTASTGLDALSHAIESAWSVTSNAVSESLACMAVRLILESLEEAVENGKSGKARENMMLASLLAGQAISSTGTTINHSISYPLSIHKGVPHGFACAVSLPATMRFNATEAGPVLDRMARACGLSDRNAFISAVEKLMEKIKAPMRLSSMGFVEADLGWLAGESFGKNVAKNPRPMQQTDMRELLKEIL